MLAHLRYGLSEDELDLPDEKLIGHFDVPRRRARANVADFVRSAMRQPLDAPELYRACTPDDHIAIVFDLSLPSAVELLSPVLHELTERAGIAAKHISIVHANAADPASLDQLIDSFPDELAEVCIVEHRPDENDALAYLASTADGQRVYLNRLVVEADLTLVMSRVGFDATTGRQSLASTLFPALSNAESLARGRQLAMESRQTADSLHSRQRCDEVAGLAGLFYGMGVALDVAGEVDRLWFGRVDTVERESRAYVDAVQTISAPEDSPSLVVAVCSASRKRSSWQDVGAALESAVAVQGDAGGAIVLVTDVEESMGPAGQVLSAADDPWDAMQQVRTSDHADAVWALQCAQVCSTSRVYFHSRCSDAFIESLNAVPVVSMHEIENLVESAESVYLIESADRVRVHPALRRHGV